MPSHWYTIKINGEQWKYRRLEDDKFITYYGEGISAITLFDDYTIEFRECDISFGIVVHELSHCYFSSLCLNSVDLTTRQIDEIVAEMLEKHILTIIANAQEMERKLNGRKKVR